MSWKLVARAFGRRWVLSAALLASLPLSQISLSPTPDSALLPFVSTARAEESERRIVPAPGADYFGHDYDILKGVDANICETACLSDNRCKAFTLNEAKGWCFLKDDVGELRASAGARSGRIAEGTDTTEADARTARLAELSFLPKASVEAAEQLAQEIADEDLDASIDAGAASRQAGEALAAGRFDDAVNLHREALKSDPTDAALWLGLARAALAFTSDDADRLQLVTALRDPAAIEAYITARTPREKAEALDLLAQSMAAREEWKTAIVTWRAAVAIEDVAAIRGRLAEAVASHGFRIVDNTVDNNAANPRICLNFSEDLSPALTQSETAGDVLSVMGGEALPVTASGSQLCVEGVTHGARYRLVARAGIASVSGETLAHAVEASVYVRDRDPSVRFSGNAYVLPAGGEASIPVTTINTAVVEARLLRIGDRELARTIGDSRFLTQMSAYEADQVADNQGEAVWKGFVDVKSQANEEVTTAIPVAAILKDRKPGVYLLSAKAQNSRGDEEALATQWFVLTDIGLTSFSGTDGFHVFARSLGSAEPMPGVKLDLVAANNEVLGSVETDSDGHARLSAGLMKGTGGERPAVLMASGAADKTGDFVFLDLTAAPFDLTDRGVEGREPAGALDVFMTPERGIYRVGDTVHLTALLRDGQGAAVDDLTLTGIVTRPDGVESLRLPLKGGAAGGLVWDVALPAYAMRGNWRFALHTDPKRPAIAETSVRVEDFEPQKIDFDVTSAAKALDPAAPPEIALDVRHLFGAPAADLAVSGEIVLSPAETIEGFAGYRFGLADDMPTPLRLPFEADATDEAGKATVTPDAFEAPATTRPMSASIQVRVSDSGGRPVERDLELPVKADKPRIGVRPLFDGSVPEGSEAGFSIVALDADGQRTKLAGAEWVLNKVTTDFQWYQTSGRWNYEPIRRSARVANGTLDIPAGTDAARLSLPVAWGGYELVVKDASGSALPTSVAFEAGWYVAARSLETPDILKVSLDKPRYKIGDKATVHIEPRFAGKAEVLVMDERVIATATADIPAGGGDVTLDVTREWGPGAYVTAVLYRPMEIAEKRMPGRAIGLAHAGVEPGERALAVTLTAPERITPRQGIDVQLAVDGIKAGETAYVTLAAVDVGILNITGFAPPSPKGFYFGKRKLGVEIRDLYSRLIDRMQGAPGAVRSGGDAGADTASTPPMDELVALFSGIVTVGPDGRATVRLDIPDFNGTLKLMAVAWSKTGVGEANAEMLVRDPIVATISRPRYLSPGDTSRIALDLNHVEGPAGRIHLQLTGGEGIVAVEENGTADLELAENGRQRLLVPVKAEATGDAAFELAMTTPAGTVLTKRFTLAVRSLQPETVKKSRFEISANGGTLALDASLLAAFQPGTGRASVSITQVSGFDVAGAVRALDRYPYGCTEQLTSRALPLVYLDRTILAAGLSGTEDVRERIAAAIKGVLANQSSNGSFGLWSPDYGDLWLDAYVTDFLTRAGEAGHPVPAEGLQLALDNLRNQINYLPEKPDWGPVAYAYYVLARNGKAAIGDLRYTADNEAKSFTTPLAKAHLAAALALYGDRVRAETVFRDAVASAVIGQERNADRSDYGTPLRDGAAVLTLGFEAKIDGVDLTPLVQKVGVERGEKRFTSTQEDAWSLLAAHAILLGRPLDLSIDGAPVRGTYSQNFDADALAKPHRIENQGTAPVYAEVTLSGVPLEAPPAESAGYAVSRTYYTLDGEEADPATIAQGDRLVALVEVLPTDKSAARLVVDDPLPAGLEIDNPAILRGGDVATLDFLELTETVAHTELRADRFIAAIDKASGNTDAMRFAYIVRAVSPGTFVHPAAIAEDMYRPDRRGSTDEGQVTVVGPRG